MFFVDVPNSKRSTPRSFDERGGDSRETSSMGSLPSIQSAPTAVGYRGGRKVVPLNRRAPAKSEVQPDWDEEVSAGELRRSSQLLKQASVRVSQNFAEDEEERPMPLPKWTSRMDSSRPLSYGTGSDANLQTHTQPYEKWSKKRKMSLKLAKYLLTSGLAANSITFFDADDPFNTLPEVFWWYDFINSEVYTVVLHLYFLGYGMTIPLIEEGDVRLSYRNIALIDLFTTGVFCLDRYFRYLARELVITKNVVEKDNDGKPIRVISTYSNRFKALIAFAIISLLDSVICIIYPHRYRLVRLFRSFYVISVFRVAKNTTKWMLKTIWRASAVLPLMIIFVLFFSILFYIVFEPIDNEYFSTYFDTFNSLFVLLTTANHPDCALKSLQNNEGYYIFFFIYMVSGWVCLSNLFLSMIFNDFHDIMTSHYERKAKGVFESFNRTFFYLRDGNLYDYSLDNMDTFLELVGHEVDLDHAEYLLRNVETVTTDDTEDAKEKQVEQLKRHASFQRSNSMANIASDEYTVLHKMNNFQENNLLMTKRLFYNYHREIRRFIEDNPLKFTERETIEIEAFNDQIMDIQNMMDKLSGEMQGFLKEQEISMSESNVLGSRRLTERTTKRSVAALANSKEEVKDTVTTCRSSVEFAKKVMHEQLGTVGETAVKTLLHQVQEYNNIPDLNAAVIKKIWRLLDEDDSKGIDITEWRKVPKYMGQQSRFHQRDWVVVARLSKFQSFRDKWKLPSQEELPPTPWDLIAWRKRNYPNEAKKEDFPSFDRQYKAQWRNRKTLSDWNELFKVALTSEAFEVTSDFIVLLSMALAIVDVTEKSKTIDLIQNILFGWFFIEVVLRIHSWGVRLWWEHLRFRFDFACVLAGLALRTSVDDNKIAVAVRVLRALRLITAGGDSMAFWDARVGQSLEIFYTCLILMYPVLLSLWFFVNFWAVFGMWFFSKSSSFTYQQSPMYQEVPLSANAAVASCLFDVYGDSARVDLKFGHLYNITDGLHDSSLYADGINDLCESGLCWVSGQYNNVEDQIVLNNETYHESFIPQPMTIEIAESMKFDINITVWMSKVNVAARTSDPLCILFRAPNVLDLELCKFRHEYLCRKPPMECHSDMGCTDWWEENNDSSAYIPYTPFFNFDTYYKSLFTLWTMIIQNNWFVIMDAAADVHGGEVRFFFYFIVVFFDLFVMNVITAFIIDAHTALSDDKPSYSVHEDVEGKIEELDKWFDCTIEEILPHAKYKVKWRGEDEIPMDNPPTVLHEEDIRTDADLCADHKTARDQVLNPRNPAIAQFNMRSYSIVSEDKEAFKSVNRHVALVV